VQVWTSETFRAEFAQFPQVDSVLKFELQSQKLR
jgi:hypothetical protein